MIERSRRDVEQPSQKRSREDQFLEHFRKAQEEYRSAIEAVSRAQSEIDSIPAVDVHLALRQALQRETRAVKRVAELLKELSYLRLGEDDS
jgi:hypothetical protein